MYEKIEKYIYNIQINNWGFPWHVLFASMFYQILFPVFFLTKLNFGRGIHWAFLATFIVVNVIGYLYEVIKKDQDKTEFFQDVAANNVGILIGMAQWFMFLLII
jgi:hypothetical protein